MKFSLAFIALTFTVALAPHSVPAAAQSRPLTAADLPNVSAQAPAGAGALHRLTGKALVERVVLTPDDGATLRLALWLASPGFVKGANIEELIGALSALRAESMKQLLPAMLAPIDAREKPQARAIPQPRAAGLMAAAIRSEPVTWPLPAALFTEANVTSSTEWPSQPQTFTAVNEYEIVAGGMTANIREEITFLFEARQVGIRQFKRETVEQNGDTAAIGKYVVEQGTMEPATGVSTIKASHARRLRPTSANRVTTETIREAKVDRCPDPAGMSHGQTLVSVQVRATAAATGNGAPSLIESIAHGTVTGRVSDAAQLAGFDWDVKSDSRVEALNAGENFQMSQGMRLVNSNGASNPVTVTQSELAVSGVGSREAGRRMLSTQAALSTDAFLPLLQSYDTAEAGWQRGGCVELTVSSGAEPKQLKSGESRKIVVDARHRYEPEPPAIPVTAKPSGGAVTPGEPVKTPAAAVTFKADANGEGGGAVAFSSISRRGIARDVSVAFDPDDGDAIEIRHVFSGFKFVDTTAEDCPGMRTNGQEVLTARVRRVASPDGRSFAYEGTGRFAADIDGCGRTPDRKESKTTAGGSIDDYKDDHFLGCKVTVVAPLREARVRLNVGLDAGGRTESVQIRWEPVGTVPDPRVTSGCEPAWHAYHVKELTGVYRRGRLVEITDADLLQGMAPGGNLRPGTYNDPEGTSEGRWTFTVTKAAGKQ